MLIGPATFLLLAKAADRAPDGFRPFDRLDDLVAVYADILAAFANADVSWVQLDEPAYVADRTAAEIDALRTAYIRLGELARRPQLFVATYFGELDDALPALLSTPIEALGLDFVAGPGNLRRLAAAGPLRVKTIVAGLVDGRNNWRTDLHAAVATGATVTGLADAVTVVTSCSLLHVPVDLDAEINLDPALRERLAFARQKVDEVVILGLALRDGVAALPAPLRALPEAMAQRVRPRPPGRVEPRTATAGPVRRAGRGTAGSAEPCRRCRPPRSGRSPRPTNCARLAPPAGRGHSTRPATSSGCAPR